MRGRSLCALILMIVMAICAIPGLADMPVQTEKITIPVIDDLETFDIPDNDAMALMRDMKCGWNLGNTFDAYNGYTAYYSGIEMESSWVGSKTRKKLIQTIKEAGFNTIRIPVSWHNHVDKNGIINQEWMDRVKQVASWALESDMYVIVNVHHDNHKRFFYPDEAHYEQSAVYLTNVWTQMAEAFGEYDDHLILESLNEPRLVDTPLEWNWSANNAQCREAAECINKLNQLFVDTIRATGGNNATRYLAVPAYDASPWYACNKLFKLPEDPADNRIIVEAHAYTPYNFALNLKSTDKDFDLVKSGNKKKEIDSFLNGLYQRFVSKGIPVMMDEFGALEKDGNLQDRVNFAAYYVAAAAARGIPCVWWDNHCFTGADSERFGLIRRGMSEWVYPDIVLAIQENCLYNRETDTAEKPAA